MGKGYSCLQQIFCMWERVNPFPHTTILQQTTLNIFCQKLENLCNWMDNLWLKVENIVAKGEIACFEQFLLLSPCCKKSCLLQRRQKASIWGKGLSIQILPWLPPTDLPVYQILPSWQPCKQSDKHSIHSLCKHNIHFALENSTTFMTHAEVQIRKSIQLFSPQFLSYY